MMKQIFLSIAEQLKTVLAIKYIDLDKGQVENYSIRPALVFPATLISITQPSFEELGQGKNRAAVRVQIRLVFNGATAAARTGSGTAEEALLQSLEYLDIADSVQRALRAFETDRLAAFEINSYEQERRSGELVVIRQVYSSSYFDME